MKTFGDETPDFIAVDALPVFSVRLDYVNSLVMASPAIPLYIYILNIYTGIYCPAHHVWGLGLSKQESGRGRIHVSSPRLMICWAFLNSNPQQTHGF